MGHHSQLYAKGLEKMRRHLDPQADHLIGRIEAISAEFVKVNVEFPYGELYTR